MATNNIYSDSISDYNKLPHELENNIKEIKRYFFLNKLTKFEEICKTLIKHSNLLQLFQNFLYQSIFSSHLFENFPPSLQFQIKFIKNYILTIESCNLIVCDEIYSKFGFLLSYPQVYDNFTYKSYSFDGQIYFPLKESVYLVSDGCTGLQTWPAELNLCEWIFENCSCLSGKKILELGAGLGLAGIVASQYCENSHVLLTDYHPNVINVLKQNVYNYNHFIAASPVRENYLMVDTFDWCLEKDLERIFAINYDVIIAADVIYDKSVFSHLLNILHYFLQMNDSNFVLISNTIRNDDTYQDFIAQAACHSLQLDELHYTPKHDYNSYGYSSSKHNIKLLKCSLINRKS